MIGPFHRKGYAESPTIHRATNPALAARRAGPGLSARCATMPGLDDKVFVFPSPPWEVWQDAYDSGVRGARLAVLEAMPLPVIMRDHQAGYESAW
jgi:hypothetical protein